MNSNKYDVTRHRFFVWLDTPEDKRQPNAKGRLAYQLGVQPATLAKWEKNREEYERADVVGGDVNNTMDLLGVRDVVEKLGEKMDLSLAEIERLIKTGTKEEKLQKARDVILFLGLRDQKFAALVEYLKSEGAYIVKIEETKKYELTSEDKAEISRLVNELQGDFSAGTGGKDILPKEPALLSAEIRADTESEGDSSV